MKLIDADVLEVEIKATVATILKKYGTEPLALEGAEALSAVVARLKTMDSVDVVRCRECKHYLAKKCVCDLDAGGMYEMELELPRSGDDYCSYGER